MPLQQMESPLYVRWSQCESHSPSQHEVSTVIQQLLREHPVAELQQVRLISTKITQAQFPPVLPLTGLAI